MDKIYIVEDDENLREELKIFLNQNGYDARAIEKFDDAVGDVLKANCDLLLLDINLPVMDGQQVLREIRKTSDIPTIMVTSRDSEIDELISMNFGADDYVTKPFNIHILLAKISAILKRSKKNEQDQSFIDCEYFQIDTSKSSVERDGKIIELTKNEIRILSFLTKNKGKIVSRNDIMDYLWDSERFIDDNTLTVNITRLKNKLAELDIYDVIETKRGQGYILK
ncbi:MAG: response regulator transcription factor [Clostridioides sp.]|jgi:DNA-binding response OmpR family regulator|nr:response regulator transcription factor [Clostridioides sp.]